jgi:ATP-binding cassette subfamily C exporter for protease/lipase
MIATTWGAYQRLQDVLETIPERGERMSLPAPNGALIAEQVVTAAPTNPNPILKGVSCGVHPGQALAIVGPSAAGKSTLAKVLLGTWPVMNGKVRLDGADIHSWNKDELGPYLGYLPQEIELFDGTIADNIARFGTPDPELLADAVKLAGLDHVVDALADGLNTEIGDLGGMLSGGQRQRVGLARAVYGRPKLVVLDEPNASLDERGEKALLQAIVELKARGTIVVIVTHRTDILQVVDLMLVLRDGQTQAFGPKDQVLAALKKAADEQRAKMEEARARAEQARLEAPPAGEPAQGASA